MSSWVRPGILDCTKWRGVCPLCIRVEDGIQNHVSVYQSFSLKPLLREKEKAY